MGRLDQLGLKHGTDKASHGHGYLDLYEQLIPDDRPVNLLEIGWWEGASVRTWRDYLHPDSTVTGVDINLKPPINGINFAQVDATTDHVLNVAEDLGPFDVVLDDGSHLSPHVIQSLRLLWPHVVPGGLYIIEDLHVSYHPDWQGWDPSKVLRPRIARSMSSMEYLKQVADDVHYGHSGAGPADLLSAIGADVASIAFHPGVAIIRKKDVSHG